MRAAGRVIEIEKGGGGVGALGGIRSKQMDSYPYQRIKHLSTYVAYAAYVHNIHMIPSNKKK